MRAAKVQVSLRIRPVSPKPPLLAHTSSESRGTFRQKARSLAPLNGWACAVKICHDGMLEDTNLLDAPQLSSHHTSSDFRCHLSKFKADKTVASFLRTQLNCDENMVQIISQNAISFVFPCKIHLSINFRNLCYIICCKTTSFFIFGEIGTQSLGLSYDLTPIYIIRRRLNSDNDGHFIYSFVSKIIYPRNFANSIAYLVLVTMLLHQPGPQLKLPSWRNKSIYTILV